VPAAFLAVELLVCEFRVCFVMKGGQVVRRAAPSSRCIESAPEHRAPHIIFLLMRASDTALGLSGTNLLDEWISDLPLIAEVVASQLAKITCPTGRQYIENRFQRQSASPGP
jgi:hypothetical protein